MWFVCLWFLLVLIFDLVCQIHKPQSMGGEGCIIQCIFFVSALQINAPYVYTYTSKWKKHLICVYIAITFKLFFIHIHLNENDILYLLCMWFGFMRFVLLLNFDIFIQSGKPQYLCVYETVSNVIFLSTL